MPNNINSSIFNSSCSQYQSQPSTSANLQCQQDNLIRFESAKNEQVISDTKPYISSSGDTPSSALNITSRPIKEKPFECSYCDKAFTFQAYLNRHQRIHTGEKPYKCTICDNSFTRNSSLKAHRRIHTGEKPYTCNVCYRGFNQNSSLTIHRRIHTGEKPYKCTDCDKSFSQNTMLNRHKQTHTRKKTYKCTICHKVFNRVDNLNQHFKKNHTKNNQIRGIINNYNDNKKNILNSSYNSIVEQCQNKSISIEETLVNIFSILDKKYILNDDARNVAKKLVSIITELPPQFKSTDCLDIRKKAKIKTYTELVFILKNHTVDEFLEKYLKIETPQSGNTHTCQLTKEHEAIV